MSNSCSVEDRRTKTKQPTTGSGQQPAGSSQLPVDGRQ